MKMTNEQMGGWNGSNGWHSSGVRATSTVAGRRRRSPDPEDHRATSVLALSVLITTMITGSGCGGSHDSAAESTDTPETESVFTPYVGAIDRAHGLEHTADEHNRALDAALRGDENRKAKQR